MLRRTLLELTLDEWNAAKRTGDMQVQKLRHDEAILVREFHCLYIEPRSANESDLIPFSFACFRQIISQMLSEHNHVDNMGGYKALVIVQAAGF